MYKEIVSESGTKGELSQLHSCSPRPITVICIVTRMDRRREWRRERSVMLLIFDDVSCFVPFLSLLPPLLSAGSDSKEYSRLLLRRKTIVILLGYKRKPKEKRKNIERKREEKITEK